MPIIFSIYSWLFKMLAKRSVSQAQLASEKQVRDKIK